MIRRLFPTILLFAFLFLQFPTIHLYAVDTTHIKVLSTDIYPGYTLKASVNKVGLSKDDWVVLYRTFPEDQDKTKNMIIRTAVANLQDSRFTAVIPKQGGFEIRIYKRDLKTIIEKKLLEIKQYEPVIKLAKNIFKPGEDISVSYTGAPIFKDAWIGFYKANENDNKPIKKSLLNGGTGTFKVISPPDAGKYEFRIFDEANAHDALIKSSIIVSSYDIELKVEPEVAEPCQEVTVKFSGLPENVFATLSIGGSITKALWYQTEGELKAIAPATQGEYTSRIFINGDSNQEIWESKPFTVTKTLTDKAIDDHLQVVTRPTSINFCNFMLSRTGNKVYGYYDRNSGYIQGTVAEDKDSYGTYKITGTFEETCKKTGEKYTGDVVIFISGDAEIIKGNWRFKDNTIWQPIDGGWYQYDNSQTPTLRVNGDNDKITLLWDEDFQEGIVGYNIYRKVGSGELDRKPLNEEPLKGIKYIDKQVNSGEKNSYLVKVVFQDGKETGITRETEAYTGNVVYIDLQSFNVMTQTSEIKSNFDQFYSYSPDYIINGNLVVPLRKFADLTGTSVDWDSKGQKVVAIRNGMELEIKPNNPSILVNGKPVKINVSPEIKYGVLYVPLRSVFEKLGCNVKWNKSENSVRILF